MPIFWKPPTKLHNNWYSDKLCNCGNFHSQNGHDWRKPNYTKPLTCRNCGKLANCITWCVVCNSQFYDWFSHPMMGYHGPPFGGFMCWNCLEEYWFEPDEKISVQRKKVAPLTMLLPPGYVLYVN